MPDILKEFWKFISQLIEWNRNVISFWNSVHNKLFKLVEIFEEVFSWTAGKMINFWQKELDRVFEYQNY